MEKRVRYSPVGSGAGRWTFASATAPPPSRRNTSRNRPSRPIWPGPSHQYRISWVSWVDWDGFVGITSSPLVWTTLARKDENTAGPEVPSRLDYRAHIGQLVRLSDAEMASVLSHLACSQLLPRTPGAHWRCPERTGERLAASQAEIGEPRIFIDSIFESAFVATVSLALSPARRSVPGYPDLYFRNQLRDGSGGIFNLASV